MTTFLVNLMNLYLEAYDPLHPATQDLRGPARTPCILHKAVLNGALADEKPWRTEGTSPML
jgi:hypothetical protein